jgi:hypothetical protein
MSSCVLFASASRPRLLSLSVAELHGVVLPAVAGGRERPGVHEARQQEDDENKELKRSLAARACAAFNQ